MSENQGNFETYVKVYSADLDPEIEATEEMDQSNREKVSKETTKKEVVIVNGPYSSCARYIFDCKHAVLISAEIGVTPYASILSSLIAQFRTSQTIGQHRPNGNFNTKVLLENNQIRKVDFIWVNQDYKSFEWFLKLLREFEQEQDAYLALNSNEHCFLTIHLYFTEIKDDQYIGTAPLELITQVATEDIFTGLKARTHFGRPRLESIFFWIYKR
ncbi:unnamed protein product [Rotaria sp. Silwood1]|nr:unnamed protein product [Rotaria sp. Silwood1]CAF4707303.1 unnamed protein product [Rotaria sp. Silwood1]